MPKRARNESTRDAMPVAWVHGPAWCCMDKEAASQVVKRLAESSVRDTHHHICHMMQYVDTFKRMTTDKDRAFLFYNSTACLDIPVEHWIKMPWPKNHLDALQYPGFSDLMSNMITELSSLMELYTPNGLDANTLKRRKTKVGSFLNKLLTKSVLYKHLLPSALIDQIHRIENAIE